MNMPGNASRPNADQMARRLSELVREGKAARVLARIDELAREYSDHSGVQQVISEVAVLAKNFPKAIAFAERALELDNGNVRRRLHLAICHIAANDQRRAAEILARAEPDLDGSAEHFSMLASLYVRLDRHDRAAEFYRRAIEREPANAKHHFSLAATYRFMGLLSEAEQACDEALECDATEYEAYLIRSDLRKQTRERNHVRQMEAFLSRGTGSYMGEAMLCHALAKECEDLELFEKSFRYLSRGAAVRRRHLAYDVNKDLELIDLIVTTFVEERVRRVGSQGCRSTEPIFIVGMPRTGTTLVERIIGSHSKVKSAGELPNFSQVMAQMVNRQSAEKKVAQTAMVPASLMLDMRELGESYIESTRGITGDTPRFIDKLPFNYLNIGLIRLALPQAKIIHVTRDPMDTCYAVFKTLFQRAYPFSYSLEDLGRYFVAYWKLMEHWKSVFPGRMHDVSYETLVNETERESRRLVEFCGLEWEDRLSRFHEHDAPSMTASASQVRQPVYRSSVGKWRNYEKQLRPLSDLLRSAGIEVRR